MKQLTDKKIEFIAKTITDLGKALVALGFASYFFERFPFGWRVTIGVLSVILIITGIWIHPDNGDHS